VFEKDSLSQAAGYSAITAEKRRFMRFIFMVLFVILLISWVCAFLVFHVAGALIHLLLLFAVIALVIHLVAGRSAT
jgi:uncharacterized membrane protein (DUF485 family)